MPMPCVPCLQKLHVRDPPPIIPTTRNGWLGDKSHLY